MKKKPWIPTKTPARRLVKRYLVSPETSWEDFENKLWEAIDRVNNGKFVHWYNTPSIEADNAFRNILRRNGIHCDY